MRSGPDRVVFDGPDVAAEVTPRLAALPEHERAWAVGGDRFESVPAGDLYRLKFFLHDWDDDRCVQILTRCREATRPGARAAIIELIVGENDDPGPAALMDLNMLVLAGGGRERSAIE